MKDKNSNNLINDTKRYPLERDSEAEIEKQIIHEKSDYIKEEYIRLENVWEKIEATLRRVP